MSKEHICKCGGILDFENYGERGFWICVNPDCEVIFLPNPKFTEFDRFYKSIT